MNKNTEYLVSPILKPFHSATPSVQEYQNVNFHSSILFHLSGVGSRRQRAKQGIPDVPLPFPDPPRGTRGIPRPDEMRQENLRGAHPDQILELPQLVQPGPAGTNTQSQSSRGRYRANQSVSVNVVNEHAAVPAAQEEEELMIVGEGWNVV